jgi:chromosome segregation ATPase
MSVEIHDRKIKLLSAIEEFRQKEAELNAERQRQLGSIAAAESEVGRCNDELGDIRENQLRLKREMDGLRDELFARPEDEGMVADEAHIPTEDGAPVETDAKRAWKDRQRQLRQVQ